MIKLLSITMISAALFCSCDHLPEGPWDIPDTSYKAVTEIGKILESCPLTGHIYCDSAIVIAPGVTETDIHLQTSAGKVEHLFILKAELEDTGVELRIGLPEDGLAQTPLQTALETMIPGKKVVAAVNGDFTDTVTGLACGPIHKEGTILKDSFTDTENPGDRGLGFFGIDSYGKPVCSPAAAYTGEKASLVECTGCGTTILQEGVVPASSDLLRQPHTCVGYTRDRRTVFFLVCDGKRSLWSDGLLDSEAGEIMKSLGCDRAVNLAGGSASQIVIFHPAAKEFILKNRPSGGTEKAVVNSWLVLSD